MFGCLSIKIIGRRKNDLFVLANEDGSVRGFDDSLDARASIEEMYRHAMNINRQFTTSACIHMCEIEYMAHDMEDPNALVTEGIVVIPFQCSRIMSTSQPGGVIGIPLLGKKARKWHKSGKHAVPPKNASCVW